MDISFKREGEREMKLNDKKWRNKEMANGDFQGFTLINLTKAFASKSLSF